MSIYAELARSKDNKNVVLRIGVKEEFMLGHVVPACLFPVEYEFCPYNSFRLEIMDNIIKKSYWQQPHLNNNCFYFTL